MLKKKRKIIHDDTGSGALLLFTSIIVITVFMVLGMVFIDEPLTGTGNYDSYTNDPGWNLLEVGADAISLLWRFFTAELPIFEVFGTVGLLIRILLLIGLYTGLFSFIIGGLGIF